MSPDRASSLRGQDAGSPPPYAMAIALPTPVPGCVCPPSYVRDVCHGHPVSGCPFNGLFGRDLARAHWRAHHPHGEQLTIDTTETAA
jgi:hypothetical protein